MSSLVSALPITAATGNGLRTDLDRPSQGAQRVLDAALELFSRRGYEGTSLQLIADYLGVTKAAVYYHFHTKDEILAAVIRPAFRELEALLDEAGARPRAAARREQGLGAYIDYLLRHRQVSLFLSQDISALSRPVVWEPAQALNGRVEALLTGGPTGGGDDVARLWGSAVLRGLTGALLSSPDAPEDWLRDELTEIGRHLTVGYRKAQRRHAGQLPH